MNTLIHQWLRLLHEEQTTDSSNECHSAEQSQQQFEMRTIMNDLQGLNSRNTTVSPVTAAGPTMVIHHQKHPWQFNSSLPTNDCMNSLGGQDSFVLLERLLDEPNQILNNAASSNTLTIHPSTQPCSLDPSLTIHRTSLNNRHQPQQQIRNVMGANTSKVSVHSLKEDISSLVYVYLPNCSLPLLIPHYSILQSWLAQLTNQKTRMALREVTRPHYWTLIGARSDSSNSKSDDVLGQQQYHHPLDPSFSCGVHNPLPQDNAAMGGLAMPTTTTTTDHFQQMPTLPTLDLLSLFQHGLIRVEVEDGFGITTNTTTTTLTCPSIYLDLGLSNITETNKVEIEKAFLFPQVVENGLRNEASILNSATFMVNSNNLAIHCLINMCVIGSTFRKAKNSSPGSSSSTTESSNHSDKSALDLLIRQALSQCETINQIVVMRRTIENLQYPPNRGQWINEKTSPQQFHATKKAILDYIDEKMHRSFFKIYELKGEYLVFLGFSNMNALLQSNALVIDASQKELQCYKALRHFLLFNAEVIRKLKELCISSQEISTNHNNIDNSIHLNLLLGNNNNNNNNSNNNMDASLISVAPNTTTTTTTRTNADIIMMNSSTYSSPLLERALFMESPDGHDYTQIPSLCSLIEFSLCVLISQLKWNTFPLFDKISLLFRLYNELSVCGIMTRFDFLTFYKVIENRLDEHESGLERKVRAFKKSPLMYGMSTTMRSGTLQGNDVPGYPSQIHLVYDSDDQNDSHAWQEVSTLGVLNRMKELWRFVKQLYHELERSNIDKEEKDRRSILTNSVSLTNVNHQQDDSHASCLGGVDGGGELQVTFQDASIAIEQLSSSLDLLLKEEDEEQSTFNHYKNNFNHHTNIQTILNHYQELEHNTQVSAFMNSAPITQIVLQLNLYHERKRRIQQEREHQRKLLEQNKKKQRRRKSSASANPSNSQLPLNESQSSNAMTTTEAKNHTIPSTKGGRRKSCPSTSGCSTSHTNQTQKSSMLQFTFVQEDGKSFKSSSKSSSSSSNNNNNTHSKKRRGSVLSTTSNVTTCSQGSFSSTDASVTSNSITNTYCNAGLDPQMLNDQSNFTILNSLPQILPSQGVMTTSYSSTSSSSHCPSTSYTFNVDSHNYGAGEASFFHSQRLMDLNTNPVNQSGPYESYMTKFSQISPQVLLDEGGGFSLDTLQDPFNTVSEVDSLKQGMIPLSDMIMTEHMKGGEFDWMNSSSLCCEDSSCSFSSLIEKEFSEILDLPPVNVAVPSTSTTGGCGILLNGLEPIQMGEESSDVSEESSGKKRKRGEDF
ncbi:hypothetical protein FDP41_005103 [Naegleria fowleri]|uniref:Uncharacterized protein n=1 Tax=Naegleria fowleri TaxID=5763 RepID=A0A6A5BLL2_NAEFO|nr:uncharacterized protein FDP41_005103 [Naegleria fowleri]KAF0975776.1 hypothetical protein FDP41_005103 [Naegleria fowleri]